MEFTDLGVGRRHPPRRRGVGDHRARSLGHHPAALCRLSSTFVAVIPHTVGASPLRTVHSIRAILIINCTMPVQGRIAMPAARTLARSYDQAVAALWRGDGETARRFERWLAPFWDDDGPSEPVDQVSELSVLGSGGRGIRWYATPTEVRGYVSGRRGCYRVPVNAIYPAARSSRVRTA